jgi:5'-3' exonuclease
VSWRMPGVKQFDALKNKMITTSDFDPVVAKSLAGDVSDNIEGYQGIGPVKSAAMARAISDRIEFLNTNGHSIYIRNLLLTDLSLCPDLLKNILYVHRELVVDAVHDKDKLFSMAEDLRVRGIITEYSDIILPFGHLLAKTTKQVVE